MTTAALEEARSHERTRELVHYALRNWLNPSPGDHGPYGPYVVQTFDDHVIYEWQSKTWQATYTITDTDGQNAVTFGTPVEVEMTYTPVGEAGTFPAEADLHEAVWTTKFVNDLPDSSFLYVMPGGKKDDSGKTTPRSLRMFPVKDMDGEVDLPHLRNALARIPQSSLSDAIKARLTSMARRMLDAATSQESERETDIGGEYVALSEQAIRADGSALIKIVQPGWGSSGYYPESMLRRDGPKVFTKGLKMFWNHQTDAEESERPEGDLRNLAGELVSDARYNKNGPAGAGLYADAKIFETFAPAVEELAPHIGVSLRSFGQTRDGKAEGRVGTIIDKLVAAKSVDFVTAPGAGGKVVQLFEAARDRASSFQEANPVDEKEARELSEKNGTLTAQVESQKTEITSLTEARKAADEKVTSLEAALKEATDKLAPLAEQVTTLTGEVARFREADVLNEARGIVAAELAKTQLPDLTKTRLTERLSANPPVKEGALDKDVLVAAVTEAVKDETEYLTKVTGSPIRGMNSVTESGKPSEDDLNARIGRYRRMGLSEAAAKTAATVGSR